MDTKYPNPYFRNKECPTCGEVFTPTAPSQKYCSAKCKGRNHYYKRKYGITEQRYEEMKEEQEHKCAICEGDGFLLGSHNNHHETLCVDHDHNTGKVRELLCHNCNRALGLLRDDSKLLQRALDYLDKHKEIC